MDTTQERSDQAHDVPDLSEILGDLSYPAEKWQITTCAEIYGVDIHTRRMLYELPTRAYRSAADIAAALS
jgi:uncharacterized protein DUF2795